MKLFKIWQDVNDDWDTFSDAIVCAENEEEARRISPGEWKENNEYCTKEKHSDTLKERKKDVCYSCDNWCTIENVKIEYIGEAKPELKKGVVCASFHAG